MALSKGTVFQLYLALRAAGRKMLRVLGDMAALGQVIDLTRHEHLAKIARRTVPDVRVLPL